MRSKVQVPDITTYPLLFMYIYPINELFLKSSFKLISGWLRLTRVIHPFQTHLTADRFILYAH